MVSKVFLFISLIFLTSCSSLEFNGLRSTAAVNHRNCLETIQTLIDSDHPIKSHVFQVEEGSLASQISNFNEFKKNIIEARPSIDNFIRNYEVDKGEKPTIKEVIIFFEKASNEMIRIIQKSKTGNPQIDGYLMDLIKAVKLSEKVQNFVTETIAENSALINEVINLKIDDHINMINRLGPGNYKGALGEFNALMAIKNVVTQGYSIKMKIPGTSPMAALSAKIRNRLAIKIREADPKRFDELNARYPRVFKRIEGLTAEENIKEAFRFIKSKEFDVIQQVGDKFVFYEVKNLKKSLDLKKLMGMGKQQGKSIFDQLMEDVEIIGHLGLEKDIYFALVVFRGVSRESVAVLEAHGVKVLGTTFEENITAKQFHRIFPE